MMRMGAPEVHAGAGPDAAGAGLRLRGRGMALLRLAWLATVLVIVGVSFASLPDSLALLQKPCPVASCALTTGQVTVGDVAALRDMGLSLGVFAVYWTALYAGIALVCFSVAGVLAWRKSGDGMALLVALALVSVGAYLNLSGVAASTSPWSGPARGLAVLNGIVALSTFAFFPSGRAVPHWTCWLPLSSPAVWLAYAVGLHWWHLPGTTWNQNPFASLAFWGSWLVLTAAQVYRYARVSTPPERQQTKWVAFGFVVLLVGSLADAGVNSSPLSLQHGGLFYVLLSSLLTLVVLVLPLSFAVAILRYRLWDIDLILNRTLVYGVLTAAVAALYLGIVGGLGTLLQEQGNLALSLLATALIAVLVQPLRLRLQRGVNRLLYGQRDEPYAVLSRLGQQLEGTLAPAAVLATIVTTVAQALKLPYVALALEQQEGPVVAAQVGVAHPAPLRLPLVYQGDTVGALLLGPRPGDDAFAPSDRRLLEDLARQAGVAASAVRLSADLQRSRERLVTAREEERRRLRRDLHDGLGPALASVTLMADAARNLLAHDPAAAAALLAEVKAQAQAATAEVRRVVYALRPPALDELGLVPALREQAAQYSQNGLRVTVEAPEPLPPLPAAVEVAAYRIGVEALTNVVRHARARTCTVRLMVDDDLQLEIADDGQGLAGARPGVGLTAVRERAVELRGGCVIEARPAGGTRVWVQLPLAGRR